MSSIVSTRLRGRPAPRLPAEQRARLHAAVKSDDSPFTTFVISPWSKHVAWWSAQRGIGPNTVTAASLGVAVAAAGCCASGTRAGYVAGALLLQGSFALDCADGQLARLTATFSPLGAWLDATFDRVKEYLVYAGLAVGASRSGDDVWALAGAALVLQTSRHLVDFSWSVTPASQAAIAAGARARAAGHRRRWHYARKVAILPIGERWALISLLTALGSPRTTLTVLLGANGLALAYMLAARLRPRDAQRDAPAGPTAMEPAAAGALEAFRDAGPLARVLAAAGARLRTAAPVGLPLAGALAATAGAAATLVTRTPAPLAAGSAAFVLLAGLGGAAPLPAQQGWPVPPALHGAEYTVVLAAAAALAPEALPAAYGLIAALVWHHYDTVYRVRSQGQPPGDLLVLAGGGFDGRTLVMAALASAGPRALRGGLRAAAVTLGGLFVGESLASWRRYLGRQQQKGIA